MALYRGSTKLSGIGNGFTPATSGSVGEVLKRTSNGYDWDSVSEFEPSNEGSADQVLTKTTNGYAWATPVAGGLDLEFVEKVVVTTNQNTAVLPNTYNYYIFVIAEFRNPSNEITSSVLKGKGESSWSNWQPDGSGLYKVMNSSFFSPNSLIELVKSGGSGTYTANFWIYKLNLPS